MMKSGNIYYAFVNYDRQKKGKFRPVLVWEINNTKLVFKITSKYKNKPLEIQKRYFPIFDWKAIGLPKQSFVDCNGFWKLSHFKESDFEYITQFSKQTTKSFEKFVSKNFVHHERKQKMGCSS